MAAVYGNADLVIGATSAEDGSRGFLGSRSGYFEGQVRLDCPSPGSKNVTWVAAYRAALPHNSWIMNREAFRSADEGPLESRAWAYQERIMARRFVSFGKHEISWECASILDCEYFTTQNCDTGAAAHPVRTRLLPPRKYNLYRKLAQNISGSLLRHAWRANVVEPYSKRELTIPSDRLVALSAIAFEWSQKLSEQYLAGIWVGDVIRGGFHWYCVGMRKGFVPEVPSWSWASVLGGVSHLRKRKPDWFYCPEIVNIDYTPSLENLFGNPRGASISLRGKVLDDVKIVYSSNSGFEIQVPAGNVSEFHIDGNLEFTEVLSKDGTRAMSVKRRGDVGRKCDVEQEQFSMVRNLYCLLLERHIALVLALVALEQKLYERLGLCVLSKNNIDSWRDMDLTLI